MRACNGGPHAVAWCGKPATVVCTARDDGPRPLQWFACDDVEHREGAHVEPIAEWFKRQGVPIDERAERMVPSAGNAACAHRWQSVADRKGPRIFRCRSCGMVRTETLKGQS